MLCGNYKYKFLFQALIIFIFCIVLQMENCGMDSFLNRTQTPNVLFDNTANDKARVERNLYVLQETEFYAWTLDIDMSFLNFRHLFPF